MVVAAAGKSWLPGFLGVVGRVGFLPFDDDSLRSDESHDDEGNDGSHKPKRDAPVNAIILTTATAAIYIWFGNFRALLTFNGLGEYSFFFLTVLGAIILRFREADLPRPFKPPIAVAVLFALVSGFVVIRGATFAPVQAVILVVLWLHGLLFYWARSRFFG